MTIAEMKVLAHSVGHECVVDRDGDVCIHPMLFDDSGVRQVSYWPDPGDFERPEKAEARLLAIVASQKERKSQ